MSCGSGGDTPTCWNDIRRGCMRISMSKVFASNVVFHVDVREYLDELQQFETEKMPLKQSFVVELRRSSCMEMQGYRKIRLAEGVRF